MQCLVVEDTVQYTLISKDDHFIEVGRLLDADHLAFAAKFTDTYLRFNVEESDDLIHAEDKELFVNYERGFVVGKSVLIDAYGIFKLKFL